MRVDDKGRVTLPKHIRIAAGIAPGSEVSFRLEGRKVVFTPMATAICDDRRARLRAAAARVHKSMKPEFRQLGADEIMTFLRGEPAPSTRSRRGSR